MAARGSVAVALIALLTCYPVVQLVLCLRHRQLPLDRRRPSAWPFVLTLAVTALWLLPVLGTRTSQPLPLAGGTLLTLGLLGWAWRVTGPAARRPLVWPTEY
ncbi:hypothetical protein ACIRBX_22085 [Kitasatospora sp. NPDC096147]|uniref:hypothetical protein n=1 Tax=Kitasatospora sp. NPDC096147 TaxID=3364093 RepID=UPI0037FAC203